MSFGRTMPLWVSHSSIRDFLACPRAYFLGHVYKDPKTGKRINITNPAMALGNTVHDVLEEISTLPFDKRFEISLLDRYEKAWERVTGELGGFANDGEEQLYKERGRQMLHRVATHPGPLLNKAVKLHARDEMPPNYLFSPEQNVILCGKVDWMEYFPEDNSVHIIDFKTGKHEEDGHSLQLAIYALLVKNLQKRNIKQISYWYLEKEDTLRLMQLPTLADAYNEILSIALQIKEVRQQKRFSCPKNGCFACGPYEKIVNKQAKYIKTSGYQDIYIVT